MNLNETNSSLVNFYEQMLLQRNLAVMQQQQQAQTQQKKMNETLNLQTQFQQTQPHQLQLNIQSNLLASPANSSSKTPSTTPSSSSTSSLLSISTKSQQSSPSNSSSSPTLNEKSVESTLSANLNGFNQAAAATAAANLNNIVSDYENKYRAYMMNAAAAAAASAFPNFLFGLNAAQTMPSLALPNLPAMPIFQQQLQAMNNPKQRQLMFENFPGLFAAAASSSEQQQFQNQVNHFQQHNGANGGHGNDYKMMIKSEEPKPQHSYIGLIALAILSSPEKKLVLSDIYQWILDNYTYFHTRGSGWRNSIRHNLSLNDCFMKSGRSSNGKGHYWTIHPANLEDFSRGDFRRRRAQRRVRKSLGLTVPEEDEEDDDDILTPPSSLSPVPPKAFALSNNLSSNSSSSSTNSIGLFPNGYNHQPHHQLFYELNNNRMKRSYQENDVENMNKRKMFKAEEDSNPNQNQILNTNVSAINGMTTNKKQENNNDDSSNEKNNESENETESFEEDNDENDEHSNKTKEQHPTAPAENPSAKKRSFNVDSLLAPDNSESKAKKLKSSHDDSSFNEDECSNQSFSSSEENNSSLNNSKSSKQISNESDSNVENKSDLDSSMNKSHNETENFYSKNGKDESHDKNFKPKPNPNKNPTKQASRGLNVPNDQHQNSPFSNQISNNPDVENWKLTFSKIMARSYKNNSSISNSNSSSSLNKK